MIFRNIITCIDNLLSLKTFGMPRNDFKRVHQVCPSDSMRKCYPVCTRYEVFN